MISIFTKRAKLLKEIKTLEARIEEIKEHFDYELYKQQQYYEKELRVQAEIHKERTAILDKHIRLLLNNIAHLDLTRTQQIYISKDGLGANKVRMNANETESKDQEGDAND